MANGEGYEEYNEFPTGDYETILASALTQAQNIPGIEKFAPQIEALMKELNKGTSYPMWMTFAMPKVVARLENSKRQNIMNQVNAIGMGLKFEQMKQKAITMGDITVPATEPAPQIKKEESGLGESGIPYRPGAQVETEKRKPALWSTPEQQKSIDLFQKNISPEKEGIEYQKVGEKIFGGVKTIEKGKPIPKMTEVAKGETEGIIYPTKEASDASIDMKSIPKGYDLVSKTVIKDGRIVGWKPDFERIPKETTDKYDVIEEIKNPNNQKYLLRPEKGEGRPLPEGWRIRSGSNVNVNVNLEKSTKGKVEQEMVEKGDALQILRDMEASFKPEYITYPGKARAGTENFFEKWGIMDATKWTADRQMWYQSAKENLLKFRKFITGVAGGEKEYDEIASAAPDPDRNSPTQFMSNVKQSKINTIKLIKRYQMILNLTGVTPTKEQLGSIALSSIKVSPEELGAIEGVKDPLGIRK